MLLIPQVLLLSGIRETQTGTVCKGNQPGRYDPLPLEGAYARHRL